VNYKDLRRKAKDGDLLLVEGRGIVSRIIRALTGQNFSHVAILVWIDGGLVVVEGLAPTEIEGHREQARIAAVRLRGEKYGYLSLFGVWLSQFTGWNKKSGGLVCSTAVRRVWNACGYRFDQTPDPGDFVRLCVYVSKIEV